jgi:3-dehydroquinate synthase
MIGAFYQPQAVVIDTDTLQTLSERELRAGVAEVIKYGIIGDAEFFAWLEANLPRLLARDPNALAYAIERSCQNKADVVARDERESGLRAILNFGHTFGHAIETATRYESWLHGEAIAAGMVMAADLSRRLGWLPEEEARRIGALIRAAGLPDSAPAGVGDRQLRSLMDADKKVENGKLRLVLLKRLGQAEVTADVPAPLLAETLTAHVRPT